MADTSGTIPKKKSLQCIWQIPYPGKTAFPAPLITFSSLPQDSWQKQFHGEKVYFGSGMYLSWQRAWSVAGEVCIGAHYMVPRNSALRLQTALPRHSVMKHDSHVFCFKDAANSKTAPRARDWASKPMSLWETLHIQTITPIPDCSIFLLSPFHGLDSEAEYYRQRYH